MPDICIVQKIGYICTAVPLFEIWGASSVPYMDAPTNHNLVTFAVHD